MSFEVVNLAQRPQIAVPTFEIPYSDSDGIFMQGNMASALVRRARLMSRWPEFTVSVLTETGRPVARGCAVAFAAGLEGRTLYPAGGWDQIAIWAAEDLIDVRAPDTVCAIEVAVHPDFRGLGLSSRVLEALRDNVGRLGFSSWIVPVRPPGKAREPSTPMDAYISRTREDGLPVDSWLRAHVRLGGQIIGIAPCSGTVQAPLERWRSWTGQSFDSDGEVFVKGGIAPVMVSIAQNLGVYVEPNVWVLHRV